MSLMASATTKVWGDVRSPWGDVSFLDISAVVDRFRNRPGAPPVAQVDLYSAMTDGVIDFRDIAATVDAFKGSAYPFGVPCP